MNDTHDHAIDRPVAPSPVLVVEDEALLRMAAVAYLQAAGFPVIEAANASEAIDLLESHGEIAAVFTDVDMPPGIDGLALAHRIERQWPDVKVVIASGKAPHGAGPDRLFLAKPYSLREVERLLREA
jgi:CheY-like chemotaxis protein